METENKIREAYQMARNYPDLVHKLISLNIESYTVDTASGTILYRLPEGRHVLHPGQTAGREIAGAFDEAATVQAIRDNQQGKSDYPAFMEDIARAGVRFYEATLTGPDKRVTYIGAGGIYEEAIPL